ncbi:MAG TPA: RHS repeat-associated core domain-containing protein [Acidimicrobiales bacterium]
MATPRGLNLGSGSKGGQSGIELTSGGVTNGGYLGYQQAEFWGGGSQLEACGFCSPSGLLSDSGGQSVQSGQDVNPVEGDYTTSADLFSMPAIGGDLTMDLTYDSGLATSERQNSLPAGSFGHGWSSVVSSGLTLNSGNVFADAPNGSEVQFVPATRDGCPLGDYEDIQKYTVPGSLYSYCAPYRVDAQLGYFSTYNFYQLDVDGGRQVSIYNGYGAQAGKIASDGNMSKTNWIQFTPSETGGTGGCPGSSSSPWTCWVETDSNDRSVTAVVANLGGVVSEVFDPNGLVYTFDYDGYGDLTSITSPAPTTTPGAQVTTHYGYSTGSASPYNALMTTNESANGGATDINYYPSTGVVNTTVDPSGATTTYNFTYKDCALTSGTDCLDQFLSATYPDGEIDIDQYLDGLLVEDTFGATNNGGADTNSWTFQTTEPSTSDQDGSIEEQVTGPKSLTATIYTDAVGNLVSYTDPMGNTTTSMYNDTGGNDLDELCWTAGPTVSVPSAASCSNPPTGATRDTYDANGDLLTSTDPLGNTTSYGYYQNGELCWEAPPTVSGGSPCANNVGSPASGAPTGSTAYTYDGWGDLASTTVAYGTSSAQDTTNGYNIDGVLTSTVPPDGVGAGSPNPYQTTYSQEDNGQTYQETGPRTASAPSGITTTYTYDSDGNVLTVSSPASTTTNTYDASDRLCWTLVGVSSNGCGAAPLGAEVYDQAGFVPGTDTPKEIIDPDGNVSTYTYADLTVPTEPTAVTEPTSTTTSSTTYTLYSPFGQVCESGVYSVGSPGSTCTDVSGDAYDQYNLDGALTSSTDPTGAITSYTYPGANTSNYPTAPTSMTRPNGTYNYRYDADGNLIQTQDPGGNWTSSGYNAEGQECYVAPVQTSALCGAASGSGVSYYTYTPAGQLSQMYDNYGTGSQTIGTYSYDASGNLLSDSNDNGQTTKYGYNDANQIACVSSMVSGSQSCATGSTPSSTNSIVAYGYNAAGQMSSTTDWLSPSNVVNYENYNALGEPQTIAYPSSTGETLTYSYDPDGNVTGAAYTGSKISALNGVSDSFGPYTKLVSQSSSTLTNGVSSSNSYDSHARVAQSKNPTANASSATTTDSYSYYNNGELETDTPSTGSTRSYAYNTAEELTSVSTSPLTSNQSYAYNADGERCLSYSYTSANNSLSCSSSAPGGVTPTTYGWNDYGQLTSSGPSTAITTYTYDGNGLRMTETSTGVTSKFDWDLASGSVPLLLSDVTNSGTAGNSYIYGPTLFGGTAPIEQINTSGTASFLSSTPSGVQAVFTGGSSPSLSEEANYTTYGTRYIQSGSVASPFGYQGSYTDPSTLIYLIGRYYDPSTDQFLSIDPDVGETGQPYAFTADDPLNETDPRGLMGTCGGQAGDCVQSGGHAYISNPQPTPTKSSSKRRSGPTRYYMVCSDNDSCYTNQRHITQQMMTIAGDNLTYVGPGSMVFEEFSAVNPWKSLAGTILGVGGPLTAAEVAPYFAQGTAAFASALAPTVGRVVVSGGFIFGVATGTDAVDLPASPVIVTQVLQNLELEQPSEDAFWQQEWESTFHADILPPETTTGQAP